MGKKASSYPVEGDITDGHVLGLNADSEVVRFETSAFVGLPGADSTVPGPDGEAGSKLLEGTVNPTSEGANGDWYFNKTTRQLFGPKASGTWPAGIDLSGPAGAPGEPGEPGTPGAPGADSTVPGPAGPQGPGLQPDGYGDLTNTLITNVQNADVNYIFVVNPNGDKRANKNLPAGIAGDMSLHMIRYNAETNAWVDYGQFTGVQGPAGTPGTPGTPGTNGTNGTNGTRGTAILAANRLPVSGDGLQGDYFVDKANGRLYGPKGASIWTSDYVQLTGPQGTPGTAGTPGTDGAVFTSGTSAPNSATGKIGDAYLRTSNGDFYRKTGASTWTVIFNISGTAGAAGQGVPTGGATGQVLAKTSGSNFATAWIDPPEGGGGGGSEFAAQSPNNLPQFTAISEDFNSQVLVAATTLTMLLGRGFYGENSGTSSNITTNWDGGETSNGGRRNSGVLNLLTGTTAAGYAYLIAGTVNTGIPKTGGSMHSRASILLPVLPSAAQNFKAVVGNCFSPISVETNRSAALIVQDGVNGGKFEIVVHNAGNTVDRYDTGITPVVNTWYDVDIVFDAAGESVTFTINEQKFGPYAYVHAEIFPLCVGVIKTAGTTTRNFMVDYMESQFRYTATRGIPLDEGATPGITGGNLLHGTAVPISQGNDNDWYLRTTTGVLYRKASGSWSTLMTLKGADGILGADLAAVMAGVSTTMGITPKAFFDMITPVEITGSPAVWDMDLVVNAELVLTANRTVSAPTNAKKGWTYTLAVIQAGSGSYVPTYPTSFDFGSGADTTPSTAVGKIDFVTAHCLSTSPLLFRCGFAKAG